MIEGMEIGYMESDRPAPISMKTLYDNKNSLKQKGSCFFITSLIFIAQCCLLIVADQSWALCRIIPYMCGKFVSRNDKYWTNYILMLEITDYLMAPILNEDVIHR